jgi:hypothetical protein
MMIGNIIKVVLIIMNQITSLAVTIALSLLLLLYSPAIYLGCSRPITRWGSQTRRLSWIIITSLTSLSMCIYSGWWFQPLWKILVSWDDSSQYMEKKSQTTNQYYYIENGVYRPTYTMGGIALYKLLSYYHSCNLNYGVYNTSGR